jgi:hypothetical protein
LCTTTLGLTLISGERVEVATGEGMALTTVCPREERNVATDEEEAEKDEGEMGEVASGDGAATGYSVSTNTTRRVDDAVAARVRGGDRMDLSTRAESGGDADRDATTGLGDTVHGVMGDTPAVGDTRSDGEVSDASGKGSTGNAVGVTNTGRCFLPLSEPNGRAGSAKNAEGDTRGSGDRAVVEFTVMSTRGMRSRDKWPIDISFSSCCSISSKLLVD